MACMQAPRNFESGGPFTLFNDSIFGTMSVFPSTIWGSRTTPYVTDIKKENVRFKNNASKKSQRKQSKIARRGNRGK